jgi:hypothetical protein
MSNIAMAWINLADSGTITASGALGLAPASRLQNQHVARKWRVNTTTANIVVDLGASVSMDTIALMGVGGVVAPTFRFRVSTVDTTGAAGDAYDSGVIASLWSADYLPVIRLITSPVVGRYVRIDVTGGVSYIEAGRLFVGLRSQFSINFQAGWERMWNDSSIRTIGRSGQSFYDLRDMYRTLNLTMDFASESDRFDIMEAIDVALGSHDDMLVITNPASTQLNRDSVWGYMEQVSPVIEPVIVLDDTLWRKTYQIRERL